jgi:hypothetical protein
VQRILTKRSRAGSCRIVGEQIADSLHIGIDCSGYDHPAIGRLGVGINDQIKRWFIRGPAKHVGSKEAGPRVAAIISIVETCRRLSLPLRAYLGSVLPGLANFPINRVAELTPNAWAARI